MTLSKFCKRIREAASMARRWPEETPIWMPRDLAPNFEDTELDFLAGGAPGSPAEALERKFRRHCDDLWEAQYREDFTASRAAILAIDDMLKPTLPGYTSDYWDDPLRSWKEEVITARALDFGPIENIEGVELVRWDSFIGRPEEGREDDPTYTLKVRLTYTEGSSFKEQSKARDAFNDRIEMLAVRFDFEPRVRAY